MPMTRIGGEWGFWSAEVDLKARYGLQFEGLGLA